MFKKFFKMYDIAINKHLNMPENGWNIDTTFLIVCFLIEMPLITYLYTILSSELYFMLYTFLSNFISNFVVNYLIVYVIYALVGVLLFGWVLYFLTKLFSYIKSKKWNKPIVQ